MSWLPGVERSSPLTLIWTVRVWDEYYISEFSCQCQLYSWRAALCTLSDITEVFDLYTLGITSAAKARKCPEHSDEVSHIILIASIIWIKPENPEDISQLVSVGFWLDKTPFLYPHCFDFVSSFRWMLDYSELFLYCEVDFYVKQLQSIFIITIYQMTTWTQCKRGCS